MTMAIPEEIHKIMKKHREIKWTEVGRQAITRKAKEVEMIEKDPLRAYAMKHALEDWDAADELFEY